MLDQTGHRITRWATALAILFAGCARLSPPVVELIEPYDAAPFANIPAQIEYPDAEPPMLEQEGEWMPPRTAADGVPTEFWDLTLAEALRIGLENSAVLKNLGGRVLDQPLSVRSVFDPSITMSNPRFGEEAALAAFDAQLRESFNYSAGSQAFNNAVDGGFVPQRKDNGYAWQSALTKTAATGTEFGLRHVWQYEDTPTLILIFFPASSPMSSKRRFANLCCRERASVLIESSGPELATTLRCGAECSWPAWMATSASWTSRSASGNLSATWKPPTGSSISPIACSMPIGSLEIRLEIPGPRCGHAMALTSVAAKRTKKRRLENNSFSLNSSCSTHERRRRGRHARHLSGRTPLATTDGTEGQRRSADSSLRRTARRAVIFDWDECQAVALQRRAELRRQMWRVKQRQLELLAAKNFLLPRLDAVAAYRVQGFGDDFMGGSGPFSNPFREVATFDNNRAQVGLQLDVPIGYRRAFAGVRHAELNLARERAVRRDQEHLISHNLGEAIANLDTTYRTIHFNEQRMTAAEEVVSSRTVLHDTGYVAINLLLESQRRLAEASINYFRGRVNHALAIRDVHFQRGTLLAYNGVHLQEGQWSACASYTAPVCTTKALHTRQCFSPVTAGQFATEFDPTGGGIIREALPETAATDTPGTVEELPPLGRPSSDTPSTEPLEFIPKLFDADPAPVEEPQDSLEEIETLLEPSLSTPAE